MIITDYRGSLCEGQKGVHYYGLGARYTRGLGGH